MVCKVINIYNKKNVIILSDKIHSIKYALEHKYILLTKHLVLLININERDIIKQDSEEEKILEGELICPLCLEQPNLNELNIKNLVLQDLSNTKSNITPCAHLYCYECSVILYDDYSEPITNIHDPFYRVACLTCRYLFKVPYHMSIN